MVATSNQSDPEDLPLISIDPIDIHWYPWIFMGYSQILEAQGPVAKAADVECAEYAHAPRRVPFQPGFGTMERTYLVIDTGRTWNSPSYIDLGSF